MEEKNDIIKVYMIKEGKNWVFDENVNKEWIITLFSALGLSKEGF